MKVFIYSFSFLFSISVFSQKITLNYYLPKGIIYDESIPKPKEIIGHQVGEWHVTHDKLVYYMRELARISDRIILEERGQTFEGRTLPLLKITSPKNHKNLEDIRRNHIAVTEDNSNISKDRPVVVYQGYTVHGNEPSGTNAALVLAYYLAAAKGEGVKTMLNNTIILLDPCMNPDGFQRFTNWVNSNKSINLNPDSNDREFHEVWPRGRTNHYWFDMNRDWLPVQLPESKTRVKTFYEWLPNILTDFHEMGTNSTYFFQPGEPMRVNPLTPQKNQDLTRKIATYHAKALDKVGSLYFSEERFDDYYYGKGSTFPDVNGSIGILFEQASSRGHLQESTNGLVSFPFTIKNQFITSLSTLKAAQELRTEILDFQTNYYRTLKNEASKERSKHIVFGDEKDAAKTAYLASVLNKHKINVYNLKEDVKINGVNYKKEHAFVVPLNQKNPRLIKAMFEKRTTFKDSIFYDVSAWTFPLAFNLDYAEVESGNYKGKKIDNNFLKEGIVTKKSKYAYVFEWHEYSTPKALYKILKKGIRAKVGKTPFSVDGKKFDYGSILIPIQNQSLNSEDLYSFLSEIASENNIQINGVSTGLTKGIDLGSNDFITITKPKVAMLVGNGIRSYDAGEVWHLFDQRYNIPITKLDKTYFDRVDLSKYTTLVVPSGNTILTLAQTQKVATWVKNGGTLIGYRDAVKWLKKNKLIKLDYKKHEKKREAKNIRFDQKNNYLGAQYTGGAIFQAKVDRSHPINFGYKNNTISLFRNTNIYIKPDIQSYNNPIIYTDSPLLSGYISEENLELLKNSVPFQVQRLGKGRVVAFTDNTNFRGFWFGTNKLLMNAVFFANMM